MLGTYMLDMTCNIPYIMLPQGSVVQSSTKYMRQTLVFMWKSTIQEKFNFHFFLSFLLVSKNFSLEGRLGTRLQLYEVLRFSWYLLIS